MRNNYKEEARMSDGFHLLSAESQKVWAGEILKHYLGNGGNNPNRFQWHSLSRMNLELALKPGIQVLEKLV